MATVYQCEYCGKIMEECEVEVSVGYDEHYCSEECAHKNGWYECEHCYTWTHKWDAIKVDGLYYCDSECVYAEGYEWCDKCGRFKLNVSINEFGEGVCSDCQKDRK